MPTLSPDDLAACRAMLRQGSQSFHAASLLLPRRMRDPATVLYAFCRAADDAVDGGPRPVAALADLADRLDRVYAGRPRPGPVDRAFAAVVETYAIPRSLPDALFEGFAWDAVGRRYDSPEELDAYAVRVAGTVGMMMAVLMGRRSEAALARAADLGIAMQLTNIARDVGEDARNGRLYLPLGWLAEEGITGDGFLARPASSPGVARVVARLLDRAERHYARSSAGIALLPGGCRPAIHAARLVYREIGVSISRRGVDPVTTRAYVPSSRKLLLLGGAVAASLLPSGAAAGPVSDAARDLVQSVLATPAPRSAASGSIERLIDILTAVDERQRRAVRAPGLTPTVQ